MLRRSPEPQINTSDFSGRIGSLIKEWRHSFAEREIDGEKVWELVTKRRKEDETGTVIDSVWPLLPVFELFVPLRPPRFTPFTELGGMMVSRDL